MRLSVLTTCLVLGLCCLACKKGTTLVKPSSLPEPDPVSQIIYPYTDTFAGALTISQYYYAHMGSLVKKDSPYRFYVRHERVDSIVVISQDTIVNFRVMRRYFNYGYRMTGDAIYHFNNYLSFTGVHPTLPIDSLGTISAPGLSLQVDWHDFHWDEIRISMPTGGAQYDEYECSFTGYLLRH